MSRSQHPTLAVSILVAGSLCLADLAVAVDVADTRLLSQPAISARHVAFAYAGDLWVASRDGGPARRLTSDVGEENNPAFSPDGELVAFSAEYDGNTDVYVVPVAGGMPRRLTWHPASDQVEGFTPDGKAVLFSSPRHVFTNRHTQFFTVPVEGGFPSQLPIPHGLRGDWSPDGTRIAYIPVAERHTQWKGYRGGTTSRIWIYDTRVHSVVEVPQPEGRCNDTDPTWIGNRVFFRSDRDGEINVYSYDPSTGGGGAVTRHTRFEDFPVLALGGDGSSTLVLEQAGSLHLLDPAKGEAERLRIGVAADLVETRPRWVDGAEWIRGADLSPSGARAVFEYRGEIVTLPAKKGDPRNVTQTTGAHERSPVWSPDGKLLAFFSDEGGEYQLHLAPQGGAVIPGEKTRKLKVEGNGFFFDPEWSPDGKKISYTDNSQSVYWVDLASGKSKLVASEPYYRPGLAGPDHSWSPDSRWLAYRVHTEAAIGQVFVHDTHSGESHAVTDGLSDVSEPVFDRSGKYLYFFASTDAGPVKDWFAMSNADVDLNNTVYLAVLRAGDLSPLAPESDEEGAAAKDAEEKDDGESPDDQAIGDTPPAKRGKDQTASATDAAADAAAAPKAVEPVRIDLDGLGQRILALPVPPAFHVGLRAGEAGKVYYLRRSGAGPQQRFALHTFSLDEREETELLAGLDAFTLSGDGKKLLWADGETWGIADAGGKVDRGETKIAVEKIQVRVDPPAEWRQIYAEAWRINRDYFYDPGMHGADWTAMGERYEQYLDHLASRSDLNRLLQWMSSELAVGHHRNAGGDRRNEAKEVPGGLLGADLEIDQGRYRFARVYGGLNWNPDLRAPLTEPGVDVREGELLLAVDGVDLDASENVYARFENTAGRIVRLTVGGDPTGKGSRVVEVVPIPNEGALRNRAWVEGNLRKVDRATGGRVAYVYVPNTAGQGHEYFKRYFYPQANKQAIIVDERFNGGGQVADYYIDHLRRPFISRWATRYGKDIVTPSAAIFGPKVMIIDETAGSGGDLLPWMFRQLDLGTLVGKRTWGGLVGVLGFPVLLDGGVITAPNLAIWTEDGFIVENVGVPPDVEVEQWPAEVIAGRDPQLERAIELVLEQLERSPPPQVRRPPFPVRAPQ